MSEVEKRTIKFIAWLDREGRHAPWPLGDDVQNAIREGLATAVRSPDPKWAQNGAYVLVRLTDKGRELAAQFGDLTASLSAR